MADVKYYIGECGVLFTSKECRPSPSDRELTKEQFYQQEQANIKRAHSEGRFWDIEDD